jgi:hypothetical protein
VAFLALSRALKNRKFKLGKHAFNSNTPPPTAERPNLPTMATILQIASRVEAAAEAYIAVRDLVDQQEWKRMFKGEMVSANLHGV